MADHSDDLFSRWSRRKTEARRNLSRQSEEQLQENEDGKTAKLVEDDGSSHLDDPDPSLKRGDDLQPDLPAADSDETEEVVELDESDFDDVDFEKLNFDSDYSRFMQKGVPEMIRRKALRKLWVSNPILANLDGMNDYDEDFTDAALVVEGLKSAYQVGRGYMTQEEFDAVDADKEDPQASKKAEEVAQTETDEDAGRGGGDDAEGETGEAEDLGGDHTTWSDDVHDGKKST